MLFCIPADAERVGNDLEEITAINAHLEDLRDATTRLREMYRVAWLQEYEPYWLDNVLVRYDTLAASIQEKLSPCVRRAASTMPRKSWRPRRVGILLQP